MKKILFMILILACIYYGFFEGNNSVSNVFKFLTWAGFIVSGFVLLSSDLQKEYAKTPRYLPLSITNVFRGVVIISMAWFGHFGYAIMWCIIHACVLVVDNERGKSDKEALQATAQGGE